MPTRNFVSKFGIILVANLLLAVMVISYLQDGAVLNRIVEALGILFGGFVSLLAVVAVLAILAVAFFVTKVLSERRLHNEAGIVTVIGVIIAALIGTRWIQLPSGRIWLFVTLLVFTLVETVLLVGVDESRAMFARRAPARS